MLAWVLSGIVCLSVCLSVHVSHTVFYRNSRTDYGDFFCVQFSSTHAKLCFKEISISPKIKSIFPGTLFLTLNFENFATYADRQLSVLSTATVAGLLPPGSNGNGRCGKLKRSLLLVMTLDISSVNCAAF